MIILIVKFLYHDRCPPGSITFASYYTKVASRTVINSRPRREKAERSPIAFMSYARLDDEYTEGYLTEFRERLERAVRLHTGKHDFEIFQDKIVRAGMELSFHTPDELVGGSV